VRYIFLITTSNEFFYRYSRGEWFRWRTFHITILHTFSVLIEVNVRAYIAHLRQECHNSKFGIFELSV